jgi:hypothetical protein
MRCYGGSAGNFAEAWLPEQGKVRLVLGVLTGCTGRIRDREVRVALLAMVAAVLLLLPATAGAQTASPSQSQYSGNLEQVTPSGGGGSGGGGDVASSGGSGESGGSGSSGVGGLPFTGLDVGMLAAVAAALLISGLILRRRPPTEVHE